MEHTITTIFLHVAIFILDMNQRPSKVTIKLSCRVLGIVLCLMLLIVKIVNTFEHFTIVAFPF